MRVSFFGALVVLAGCDLDFLDDHDDDDLEMELLAQVEADLEVYDTWGQAPGIEGVQGGVSGFHGDWVQIWYNDIALGSLTDDPPVDGSSSFKESYDDAAGTMLAGIGAMLYDDDYGWFYAEIEPDGEIEDYGRYDVCISCHEGFGANGYLAPFTLAP